MYPLTLCTLTGVDDAVDLNRLAQLSRNFSFVEWGVLYSRKRAGVGRYPSLYRISEVIELSERLGVQIALHVCGSAVYEVIAGETEVVERARHFHRVQLNLSADDDEFDVKALSDFVCGWRGPVITQHNAANANLWRELSASNHEILFDTSGGRGVTEPPPPYISSKRLCGYAGGLSPENIATRLPEIAAVSGLRPFWIDMESSLRTEDRFDLDRAEAVLEFIQDQTSAMC